MATKNGTDTQENYFSVNGDVALNTIVCAIGLGGPNPQQQPGVPSPPVFTPPSPQLYDAILKLNASNLKLVNVVASQGFQDSLNIALSKNLNISGTFGQPSDAPGQRTITIKGACQGIVVSGLMNTRGNSWFMGDVSIDDWIDQTYTASNGIDLSGLQSGDGKEGYENTRGYIGAFLVALNLP